MGIILTILVVLVMIIFLCVAGITKINLKESGSAESFYIEDFISGIFNRAKEFKEEESVSSEE